MSAYYAVAAYLLTDTLAIMASAKVQKSYETALVAASAPDSNFANTCLYSATEVERNGLFGEL